MGRDSSRRPRPPVALRRMGAQRTVLAAVILTVALTAVFAAALAAYSGQAGNAAVRSALANSSAGTSILFTGSAPQQPAAAATADLQGRLSSALGGVGVGMVAAPELESLALPGSTPARGRVATLLGAQDLSAHARLVAGSWPAAAGGAPSGGAVPIAVNQNTAALLRLHVGGGVRVDTPTGNVIEFTIAGVFSPENLQSAYWSLDPLGGVGEQAGTDYTTFGPFFTDPSYLAAGSSVDGGALAAQQMEWVAQPDLSQFGTGGLGTLGANLSSLLAQLGLDTAIGAPESFTGLPQLLAGLSSAALVARSLVSAELLELLVVAIAALLIVVRLLTETRETEAALLWARGGTGPQLLRLRAVESLLLAAPAVLIAPFTAQPLAAEIGRLGASSGGALAIDSVGGGALLAVWIAVAAAAATAVLVILAPALTSAVSPLALRARRGRQAAVTAVGRAGFDLALLALAVVACWQLLSKDSIVGTDQAGDAVYSPVAIAAPALALAAGAVAVLRLLPLAARLGDLAARRGRSLAVPLAFWQTGRRPLKLAGPVLLTMLAVAAGVLSFSEYASADRSAADQAAFSTGSDVDARFAAGLLGPAGLAALAASPGVSAVSPLYRDEFTPGNEESQEATFLAIDPASAARALILRPDLSPVPLGTLMARLAAPADPQGEIPAIATGALANLIGLRQGSITSVPVGELNLKVRIVAVVAQFPTVADGEGGLIVDGSTALRAATTGGGAGVDAGALAANEVWLRDTSSAAPHGLPAGSVVTYRAQLQDQLRSAPLSEEPMQALLAVAVATVLLALCGMVVGVVSASGERAGEFALLDALGISRRGRIGLLCTEQLLLAGPGAVAGIALGLLLGRIVVPVATLTANAARPQPPVSVLTPWAPVLRDVLVVLAVPLATAALAGARRPNTAGVLREGADR